MTRPCITELNTTEMMTMITDDNAYRIPLRQGKRRGYKMWLKTVCALDGPLAGVRESLSPPRRFTSATGPIIASSFVVAETFSAAIFLILL